VREPAHKRGGVIVPQAILDLGGFHLSEKLLLALLENLSRKSGLAFASVKRYAERLGTNERTVRRLLRRLENRKAIERVEEGGGRLRTAVYRLMSPPTQPGQIVPLSDHGNSDKANEKPGQNAPLSDHENPDKVDPKGGQIDRHKGDKVAGKPGQNVPRGLHGVDNTRRQGEKVACAAPPLPARAGSDGDKTADHSGSGEARLLEILRCATGRAASNGSATKFLEAVQEARAAGATDPLIAFHTMNAATDAAPWIGPNAARDAARAIQKDFARLDVRPSRKTVADVLSFIHFCRTKLADPTADDEAAATWRRVTDWADVDGVQAEALRRAATWPEPAAVPAGGAP
jgi:DNA-binding transcriptional ArsR family regulator